MYISPCCPWISYVLGYAFSCFVAHLFVSPAVNRLWVIAEKDGPKAHHAAKMISLWFGVAERAVFTTSVVLLKPEGIAVWLAFKAVVRWKVSEEGKDASHVPGSLIYMIGTALNIGFGILGGFIALGRWSF